MIIADIANRVHTGVLSLSTGGKGDPADHAVGVDMGDLCAELDQRIGDPIERAVGRYLDKAITRHIRENVVHDLAEKIITYDRVVKESNG